LFIKKIAGLLDLHVMDFRLKYIVLS
jgi:hypothetical protein